MNATDWIPVSSSNMAGVKYDATLHKLYVRFQNGSVYIYSGVPADELENLTHASSPGQYLRSNIVGVYAHERG